MLLADASKKDFEIISVSNDNTVDARYSEGGGTIWLSTVRCRKDVW